MGLLFKQVISAFLTLPGIFLIGFALAFLALASSRPRLKRIGWWWGVLMLCSLWAASTEAFIKPFYAAEEARYPLWRAEQFAKAPAQAIVVLSGGRELGAQEYGGATLTGRSIARLAYGIGLAKASQLPMVYTGGNADSGTAEDATKTEAAIAGRIAREQYGYTIKWLEDKSRDTQENAQYTAQLLQPQGIRRIVLVTHVWHMRRSIEWFTRAGFEVQAAPMGFIGSGENAARDYLPSAPGLLLSYWLWREQLGRWVQQVSSS